MSRSCRVAWDQGAVVKAPAEAVGEGKPTREKLLFMVVIGSGFTWDGALEKW